jgi:molybdopterin-guanine dinucleotide biosynthesis protein A
MGEVGGAGQRFGRLKESPVFGARPIDARAVDLLASRGRQKVVAHAGNGDHEKDKKRSPHLKPGDRDGKPARPSIGALASEF